MLIGRLVGLGVGHARLLGDLRGRIASMAHIEFFGDSYQYAHRVLLETIAQMGEWTVHPMMFRFVCNCQGDPCPNEPGGGLDLLHYASFLGLQREQVLPQDPQAEPLTMENLVGDVQHYEYLFLDPDIGIPARAIRPNNIRFEEYLQANLLAEIARQEGRQIVLVFDHSYQQSKLAQRRVRPCEAPFLCGICQIRNEGENPAGYLCNRCNAVTLAKRKLEYLCQEFRGEGEAIHCGAVIVRSNPVVCYVWVSTNQETVEQVRGTLLDELAIPDWRLLACPCGPCQAP